LSFTPLVSYRESLRLWGKVGLLNFGGPAGQIALMHRLIVDEKKWLGEARFLHALNFCMLLPGPEAQQLATYVGWLTGGFRGGLIAGGLFVLPGALVMLALSIIYAKFADVPVLQGLLFGVKAAVVAIVVEALLRIAKRALKSNLLRAVAVVGFIAIFAFAVPFPLIVLGAGLFGAVAIREKAANGAAGKNPDGAALIDRAIDEGRLTHIAPSGGRTAAVSVIGLLLWFVPLLLVAMIAGPLYGALGIFFSKMAVVTFGGAYAVLAYVADQAVNTYHWLKPPEMLHALGLAETTPGPLILVLQFVGFLASFRAPGALSPIAAGVLGSVVTLWATFVPSFLWIFAGAPYSEALRKVEALRSALSAITAAVVGVVLNLTVWFAIHALFGTVGHFDWGVLHLPRPDWHTFDVWAAVLAVAAAIALLRFHVGVVWVLLGSAVVGALIRFV
jgi:chromate transporter